jgi:hypothetical protein
MNKTFTNMFLLCSFFLSIALSGCEEVKPVKEDVSSGSVTSEKQAAPGNEVEESPFPENLYKPRECECTRDSLNMAVESYIEAQKTGDISKMALASDVKFFENMSETTRDKGLWNTALPVAFHRSIYDAARCRTFTEIIVTEGENQYVIGTRLWVDKGEILEINSLVTDKSDWLFNAEDYLKYSSAEVWPVLPVDNRVSRQELIDAANQYFDFVFLDKGIRPPWGAPCARLEGGAYTKPDGNDKDNCQIPAPLGEMFVNDRTYVVDEELGAVNVYCRFGDSATGMPDAHTFVLNNGKYRWVHTLSVNLTNEEVDVPEYTPREDCKCTREKLQDAAKSYIEAQESGNISKMVLSPDVKFFENMIETTRDNGLWNTPLPVALHRSIYDTGRCRTFSEVIVTEGGHPYVIGTRLEVDNDGRITRIDSLVTDKEDWLFNAEDYLKYSSAEDWPVLPLDDRVSRQDLIDAANQYFDFVFMDEGIRPPWGTPCARLEGGAYTNPDGNDKDNCQIPSPLGRLPIVDRTYVVDEEMGTVNVFCRFGASTNGMPDSHTFRLVKGKYRWIHTLSVNLTPPPAAVPENAPAL